MRLRTLAPVLAALVLLTGCSSTPGEFQNQSPSIDVAASEAQVLFDSLANVMDAEFGPAAVPGSEGGSRSEASSGRTMCESGLPWTREIRQEYPKPVPGFESFSAESKTFAWPLAASPTLEDIAAALLPILTDAGFTQVQPGVFTNGGHDSVRVDYLPIPPRAEGIVNNVARIVLDLACYPDA
jgi:hypothetical protein